MRANNEKKATNWPNQSGTNAVQQRDWLTRLYGPGKLVVEPEWRSGYYTHNNFSLCSAMPVNNRATQICASQI